MDKCRREKDKLHEIASMKQKDYYQLKECSNESYFVKRNNEIYIREYGFETLPELKEELNKMWNQDEIMRLCMQSVLLAAFKYRHADEFANEGEDKELSLQERNVEKLSPFIYNF